MGVGFARAALESALDFACTTTLAGKPLVDYQEVQLMLADMIAETGAIRSMVWDQARVFMPTQAAASMTKLYCSEMAGRAADRAVQIFGGRGYMRENVAERLFRELRVERIWEGASEIQRLIVGRALMTRGPAALLDPL